MSQPTPEELRQAAEARTYGLSASSRIDNSRSTFAAAAPETYLTSVRRAETLPTIRITAELSERLAAYANTNHLNTSDTVRTLLTAGLDALEAS